MDLSHLTIALAEAGLTPSAALLDDLRGNRYALNPQEGIYPASMLKVPLVAATLSECSSGRFSLDDGILISHANMTANDAESPLVPGYRSTVRELCERAIERSDNVATNELFDLLGRERANEISRELGLTHTVFARKLSGADPLIYDASWDGVSRNTHPVSDAAHLFGIVANNERAWSAQLFTMLQGQVWNDKLSLGLRNGDAFAHKTGDTSEVTHDGGILRTQEGRVYVLIIYAAIPSSEANNARFGAFMRALRPHL